MKAAIIQARYGSTRLPGKVLEILAGRSVLSHVIERCRATPGIDVVCCAIPETSDSDGVAEEAQRWGALVVRGSESDVLGRFANAAETIGADIIMRVTSDCPLSDPKINGRVLNLRDSENADYACNNMPRAWPLGLDCEAFTRAALDRAAFEATNADDREHVTPWLRVQADVGRANLSGPGGKAAVMRWTLDYPEDLDFLRALHARLPREPAISGFIEIGAALDEHPEIVAINAHRSDRGAAQAQTATQGPAR